MLLLSPDRKECLHVALHAAVKVVHAVVHADRQDLKFGNTDARTSSAVGKWMLTFQTSPLHLLHDSSSASSAFFPRR